MLIWNWFSLIRLNSRYPQNTEIDLLSLEISSHHVSCLSCLPIFLLTSSLAFTLSVPYHHHPPESVIWFQTAEVLSSALSILIQIDDSAFWMPNALITSSAINHLLPVPSSPNGAFILIVIYYWYLGFFLMSWTSKWIDHKHFKSRNCLRFFVSSNAPTTVAFLLCVLINIFIWFDFTEIVPGYADCILHNNCCFFKMSHVIFWAQYESQ